MMLGPVSSENEGAGLGIGRVRAFSLVIRACWCWRGGVVPAARARGHHGFVKWGHDAKVTKIGIILTRGSPGQGKANGSQDRKQDLGLISECTTWN